MNSPTDFDSTCHALVKCLESQTLGYRLLLDRDFVCSVICTALSTDSELNNNQVYFVLGLFAKEPSAKEQCGNLSTLRRIKTTN